ncbi:MAG: nuclear transport factor 2 family protein [Acidobacteria bacterium]|nr:nuclear transport factor 2 family protein [Acidobacteriota bacterium]
MDLIEKSKAHFAAIIDKRVDDILSFYADSPDLQVFVEGPRWVTVGFDNVAKGWRDFCSSEISMLDCNWVEALYSKVVGKMGFVGGIVELTVSIKGEIKHIKFRGTFVFEEVAADDWRVVHEHFSQPAADPYGIGDWLK